MAGLVMLLCLLAICPALSNTVPPMEQDFQDRLEKEKSKTTFVVPRSNAIQIAFGGGRDDPQTSLHVDLLKLYKEVMEEILQRNKLISTVQTLLEKVSIIDELVVRVRTLEDSVGKGYVVGATKKPKTKKPKDKVANEGQDLNNTLEYEAPSNVGEAELGDWEMLLREVQRQGAQVNAFREQQGEVRHQYNDVMAHIRTMKSSINTLETEMTDRRAEAELCKHQNLAQAEQLESHTTELHVHKSSLEVLEAKVHKLTLDVQWQGFKISMQENTTENVKLGLQNLESFLGTAAGPAGARGSDMFAMWSRAKADIERCQGDVNILQKKMRHMEDDLQTVSSQLIWMRQNFNTTSRHGINDTSLQALIEDTASRVFNMIHGLNVSQRHISSLYAQQQKQLDDLSLDVERMKDELENYNQRLTDISRHLEYLKDYNLHGRRDRERMKRKMEKLQRDIRTVIHGYDGATEIAGMTLLSGDDMQGLGNDDDTSTESEQLNEGRSVQKRTTSARRSYVTPASRDTTLPGTTHAVTMVTKFTDVASPEARTANGENYEYEDKLDYTDEIIPDYDELARETISSLPHNCTVRGFGSRRVIGTFIRALTGAWMRDSAFKNSHIYVLRNNIKINRVKEYESEAHLGNKTVLAVHHLPFKCSGTGHIIFHHNLFCNRYKTNKVVRYDLHTKEVMTLRLTDAGHNHTGPHSSGVTDIDLAVDELGLWVIFGSESQDGNLAIARIDHTAMTLTRVWVTQFPKSEVSNTFMICGRLYATRYKVGEPLRVAYVFDTVTGVESHNPYISFNTEVADFQTSLDYNPQDHRLYSWVVSEKNYDGQLVTYDVQFGTR